MLLQSRQSTEKDSWSTDPFQVLPQVRAPSLSHLSKYSGSVQLSVEM